MQSIGGFIDFEKVYNMVNRGALWQVLRMYIVWGKLLSRVCMLIVQLVSE